MSLFTAIEFSAVIVFALYGVLLAIRHQMDAAGVVAVAMITSFGGGTLRDFILGRQPLFWVENEHYTIIVFVIAVLGSIFHRQVMKLEKWLKIPDALGMGLFSIVGAEQAMAEGTGMFIAALIGVITGTFGGVIADIVCNRIPAIFRPSPLSATCAFVGAWVFLLLSKTELPSGVPSFCGIAVVFVFRMLCVKFRWSLPPTSSVA